MDTKYRAIIVEDSKLELRGTEEIFRHEIPQVEIIGTADSELALQALMDEHQDCPPQLLLLDLGLGGSTTVGVDICRKMRAAHPELGILIFTGELINEALWLSVIEAGANGICLKSGELLTSLHVMQVLSGRKLVFNEPIMERIFERFSSSVHNSQMATEAAISYELDEFDERFLRHLALGYTKEMIAALRNMPFGTKSLEKRQADLIKKLFPDATGSINATRLVVRAIELRIIDVENLVPDDE